MPRRMSVAFPENPVGITLYVWIRISHEKAFGAPKAVFVIDFDAAEVPAQLLCDDGGSAAARERVKDTVAGL